MAAIRFSGSSWYICSDIGTDATHTLLVGVLNCPNVGKRTKRVTQLQLSLLLAHSDCYHLFFDLHT
jgi:hypothetical protein